VSTVKGFPFSPFSFLTSFSFPNLKAYSFPVPTFSSAFFSCRPLQCRSGSVKNGLAKARYDFFRFTEMTRLPASPSSISPAIVPPSARASKTSLAATRLPIDPSGWSLLHRPAHVVSILHFLFFQRPGTMDSPSPSSVNFFPQPERVICRFWAPWCVLFQSFAFFSLEGESRRHGLVFYISPPD